MSQSNNPWLNKDKIRELSLALEIEEAFIEKDLHLIAVLELMKNIGTGKLQFIFSGGTALSKGHRLIDRFSEDIDFIVQGSDSLNKAACSNTRKDIIEQIRNAGYKIDTSRVISRDGSRFCSFYIEYPNLFDTPTHLRQEIKLEIKFMEPYLEPETKLIESFFCNQLGNISVCL